MRPAAPDPRQPADRAATGARTHVPPPPPTVPRVEANPWARLARTPAAVPAVRPWWQDWRSWVGGTGRAFIAIGLLLFAFVGYQLWGTGIEQARSQDDLNSRFRKLQAQFQTASTAPATPGAPTGTRPVTTLPATTAPPGAPAPGTAAPAPTPAPAPLGPATTAAPPVTAPAPAVLPSFRPGDPIALIRIPRLGVEQTVVSGVGRSDLQRGPGHFRTTPLPGGLGNSAIAGHRTTFGEPFRDLDALEPGDRIEITDVLGRTYVYLTQWRRVVAPDDLTVLDDSGLPELTLITCDPPFTAAKRLIVRARLVDGLPDTAPPTPAVVPEPLAPPVSALPAEPTAPNSTPSTVQGTGASATTATTTAGRPAAPSTSGSLDGFEQTWFADAAAWPHVALWGSALGLVAILAWVVSRLAGRNWLGAVLGVGPFVVVLYFFFQNVNRLLPAGF